MDMNLNRNEIRNLIKNKEDEREGGSGAKEGKRK